MLGAPTQRWLLFQQTSALTPNTHWCEIPAEEPTREHHEWELQSNTFHSEVVTRQQKQRQITDVFDLNGFQIGGFFMK